MLGAPILHFAVLAGLLFGLHAAFAPAGKPVLAIDPALVDAVLAERASLTGRAQTAADRRALIDALVAEEVLLREARARGLDATPRIRALLVQSARVALASEVPPPTEADLREMLDANAERFARPGMVSVVQVFFPAPQAPPEGFAATLNAGADPRRLGALDPQAGGTLRRVSEAELARAFGPAMAATVMGLDDGPWHGPLASPRGTHFVRIEQRWPREMPDFDTLRPHLAEAWLAERRGLAVARRIAELAAGYDVLSPTGQ